MRHTALRVCACAAWVWLLSAPAVPAQDAPPAGSVEELLREGEAALHRGKLERAEELLLRALDTQERLSRSDLQTARILTLLGEAAHQRQDLDRAQAHLDRAFSLLEVVGPESLEMAEVLNDIGVVARHRGQFDRAEEYYRRSLALYEKRDPDTLEVAQIWNNLGMLARYRSDLVAAEQYHRRALALKEKLAPNSLTLAATLNNLAQVAVHREDFVSAESYSRRSLTLSEAVAPGSLVAATVMANLGVIVRQRGDLATARSLFRRALAIRQRLAPQSQFVAESLAMLGQLAQHQGDRKQAEALARQALAIDERVQPDSLRVASRRRWLGELALEAHRWDEAEGHLARALSIIERLQPGSVDETRTRHARGRLFRQRGRRPEAAEELRRAVDILEVQIGMLGGISEDRTGYRAQRGAIYADLIEVLVELGRAPEAFHVLERSRARGLLEMMSSRDLAAAERVPEPLEADRRRVAGQYDRTQRRLAEQDARASSTALAALRDELHELRRRHSELVEEMRRQGAGPSLRYPQPLDLPQTKAALEPGTLLLSYAVGDQRTHLFAVSRDGDLTVSTLPIGRSALQRDVELFRRLIQHAAPLSPRVAQLAQVGHRLYQGLIAPIAPRLERCQRMVIVPDGPLHVLPFAALVRERGTGPPARRQPRYLVEWRPLSIVPSATVYGELRQRAAAAAASRGAAPSAPTLLAFGDPILPAAGAGGGDISNAERALFKEVAALEPLPAARREVDGIAALFPGKAQAFLGEAATEERAKGLSSRVRYVHFATHVVLDDASPMDTALVLADPERAKTTGENGLLQAWEVLEQLHLNADLVALSACDSGLGRELRGEGLLGLTRAFQHAGAQSVLASLWRVGDEPAAALMVPFYRHLMKGLARDEALRAAQLELIDGGGRATLPYHWAAFQLHGDGH
jgi:CHAT domain-containing protein/Tfp pilus assembly protein PilF